MSFVITGIHEIGMTKLQLNNKLFDIMVYGKKTKLFISTLVIPTLIKETHSLVDK